MSLTNVSPVPIITRAVSIASDLLVLLVTWQKTATTWKMSLDLRLSRPSLTTLLIRDGKYHARSFGRMSDARSTGTLYFVFVASYSAHRRRVIDATLQCSPSTQHHHAHPGYLAD